MADIYRPRPITAELIKKLAKADPPASPKEIRDSAAGLILRHQPSGYLGLYANLGRGKRERLCDARLVINASSTLTIGKVKSEAAKVRGQHVNGRNFASERKAERAVPTFTEYLDDTFEPWAKKNRRSGPATVARLRSCFEKKLGKRKLTEITPARLEKWRADRKVKPETINRDIGALRSALARAVKLEVIDRNPLEAVEAAETDRNKRVVRALTAAEKGNLLDALEARDDRRREERASANQWRLARGREPLPPIGRYADALTPAVITSLETGLRRGELFALEWPRVDLKEKTVRVAGSTAKTFETRDIPLDKAAVETLRNWWLQCGQPERGHVFTIDGEQIKNLRKSYAAVLAAAGIERINAKGERVNWHSLRHTFGTLLGAVNVDPTTLMKLMGHANLETTQRYLHSDEDRKRAAVEKLEAV